MVVNINGYGRLGNQLLHFASFISNSVEYDYRLIYYGFDTYARHFPYFKNANFYFFKTNESAEISRKLISNKVAKAILFFIFKKYKTLRIFIPFVSFYEITLEILSLPDIGFDIDDSRFISRSKKRLVFINGWRFNDLQNMEKHRSLITEVFKPSKFVDDCVQIRNKYCRSFADIVIGVHIRRTDYKDYMDGRWFYDLSVYVSYMNSIAEYFRGQFKSVIFIICTDESIEKEMFAAFQVFYENTNFMIDLYSLALCDYIIGPPSTFSGWASFYGKVPIFYMESNVVPLDFRPEKFIEGYHHWHCKSESDIEQCLIR